MKLELTTLMGMLDEADLRKGFEEIVSRRKTRVPEKGVITFIHELYRKRNKLACSLETIESEFLFEIAKHHYKETHPLES